jgi:hypothetical protein
MFYQEGLKWLELYIQEIETLQVGHFEHGLHFESKISILMKSLLILEDHNDGKT